MILRSSAPRLETERLILRPPAAEDFEPLAAMLADVAVARWVGGVQGRTGAWRSLATIAGAWSLHGFGMFSVLDKATGHWLGRIGPWQPAGWPGPEIGWAIVREAWGRGVAFEATARTVDWAKQALGWRDMIHPIHPDNVRSVRVAERLGSRRLADRDTSAIAGDVPMLVYGRSLDDWPARQD